MKYYSFLEYIKYHYLLHMKTHKPQKFEINGVEMVVDGTKTAEELGDYYIKHVNLDRVFA